MSDNIKVVVKVRPLISREIEDKLFYQWRVQNDTLYQIDQNGKDVGPEFTFDKVYNEDTKTSDVYNDVAKPIVEAATAGFNGTIFAYGQTSSGKTYTMTGTEEAPGIIPLAILNLFEIIKSIPNRDFLVRVSYVEIYNETLIDLLNIEKKHIKIQDSHQGVKVDATEKVTSSPEEVLDVMKEGKANRQTAATNMNEESSRSHSIFQITIESREHVEGEEECGCVNVSQLNLVDLAGSERAGQTGATGLRFKEGTHINKSLSSLALVIKQLSDDPNRSNRHVNYRDSKLTRILQNSLGGNAKTSIICAVTPAMVEETISTLQFANRAKSIKNKPAVNAVATNATMIQQLTKQLSTLKTELENKKSLEKDNCYLQKQIAALQRLILNGFGQRSTAEILNPRRKLVQPRRITISTLHSIQEDPIPTVPKFCTPSLKYNPLVVSGAPEFQPIQTATSLPTLPEEPVRLVTPPPKDKKVNFDSEIIELDSDDDSSTEVQTCPTSPYHKCYESSKTPPCILRKNAKRAEKNLKDIVELTEREKIFTPSVVELMEKLDENATVIAKLEDEINKLSILSKEKDIEMEKLRSKINKAEEEMNVINSAKLELEAICKEYNTKLTDSEVSYETLKKKAKSREQELLSLLEEQSNKKTTVCIGKIPTTNENEDQAINFLEVTHDISLVNSDSQKIVITDDPSLPMLNQISDLQGQIALKDDKIRELELSVSAQVGIVASLEKKCCEYQNDLEIYKEKLSSIEKEVINHKTAVDSLNEIIETQNQNIQSVNSDIESYKKLVQELQIKLRKKDNINISNKELENLIAAEENYIANNENISNIIQSFKIALQSKNKEIKSLKMSVEKSESSQIDNIRAELTDKDKFIETLKEEIQTLKSDINKMLLQQTNWEAIEKELNIKLNQLEESNSNLTSENESYLKQIQNMKEEHAIFRDDLLKKDYEIKTTHEKHMKEIEDKNNQIKSLEIEISTKDNTISVLNKTNEETQEHFAEAKSALSKVQSIVALLTGDIRNVPDIIDNFVLLFRTLVNDLSKLEKIASDIMVQKEQLIDLIKQCDKEYVVVGEQIDAIIESLNDTVDIDISCKNVTQNVIHSTNEQVGNGEINQLISRRQLAYEKLINKIDNLVVVLDKKQNLIEQNMRSKDSEISDLKVCISNQDIKLKEKTRELLSGEQEMDNATRKRDQTLKNILNKCIDLTLNFNIENNISCNLDNNEENTYEEILLILHKIANHIEVTSNKNKEDNLDDALNEAKKQIIELTEQNLAFMNDISRMEATNVDISKELEKIRQENKDMAEDLEKTDKILGSLRQELKRKVGEMDSIEVKARQWKDQFDTLDFLMKEQLHALRIENTHFRTRFSGSMLKINDNHLENCESDCTTENSSEQSLQSDSKIVLKSPLSLVSLCCNRIIEAIKPNESERSESNTNINVVNEQHISCQCDKFEFELKVMKEENSKLECIVSQLQSSNQNLLREHDEVQNEVKSLLDITYELQKKVINHRTNLSTLTATTYAENKSLSSQVKFLQHLHNRFHTVCQRDIPSFKNQLHELMTLLKSENVIPTEGIKRFSLPNTLDSTNIISNFKNESTLDGDLLMLDTNVTLTTTGETTLVGDDQACFDVTQVCVYNEVACQTVDLTVTEPNLLNSQMTAVSTENYEIMEKLDELKKENNKLREMFIDYSATTSRNNRIDVQTSPFKNMSNSDEFSKATYKDLLSRHESVLEDLDLLNQKITSLEAEKLEIQKKYNNLLLEIPSTDALVKKLCIFEKEYNSKVKEIETLKSQLQNKNKEMTSLQIENDNLSTQVMEVISELDDLKKEYDDLKTKNTQISENNLQLQNDIEKLKHLEETTMSKVCSECETKDKLINSLQDKITAESHVILSRSLSDSDRSSSYNTICTLQNELHAGKEDCNKLKEEVTTIKNHLDRSNLSMTQAMDLDESMSEANNFTCAKDFDLIDSKCSMPYIPEERPVDIYALDKADCLSFYTEITGATEDLDCDFKIIDIMKLFYTNVMTKHANEVENLVNKLRDFEDYKKQFELQLEKITKEYSCKTKELQEKATELQSMNNSLTLIKDNILLVNNNKEIEYSDVIKSFNESVLKLLDSKFGLNSSVAFQSVLNIVVNKFKMELDEKSNQCCKLECNMRNIQEELDMTNSNLTKLRSELIEKENDYDLLKKQKESIQEINSAITLDIVKKEKELDKMITDGFKKLSLHNILNEVDINQLLPTHKNIDSLCDLVIKQFNDRHVLIEQHKNNIIHEVESLKTTIETKDVELRLLTERLHEKENDLLIQTNLVKDLNQIYDTKVEENKMNLAIVQKLTTLESDFNVKEQNKCLEDQIKDLLQSKEDLQTEINNLKSINNKIVKEKDDYANLLEESSNTIKDNKKQLEAMTSEILVLKESVKENVNIIENMKLEIKSQIELSTQLKEQLQEKIEDCSRLQMNIKTHEKTAEIQSRMITRLQKQKEEDVDKDKQIGELKQKCERLQKERDSLQHDVMNCREELRLVQGVKETLETQIAELQEHHKPRLSEATTDVSRRRRQSIHDSKRFSEDRHEPDEHHKMEAVFGACSRNDDFFMDVDGVESNRSTPLRLSKGRDSSQFKNDQSDKDDDPPSRPSSVLAARRRRQSLHDLHRSVLSQTPSPHDNPRILRDIQGADKPDNHDNEVTELRKQLTTCQEELEDLREKYKELDEECETCAQYLREREEQCIKLKREKRALETAVNELRAQLDNPSMNRSGRRNSVSDAAVNTDEDWSNLHSVVVDRMSYDAEVEKNKKLTKIIEELRFKKQDLAATIAKMQKALEKKSSNDNRDRELEATKSELRACKEELEELKVRIKELDEECDTCAEYLRERDEQCRKLKEAKAALEAKLKEYEDDASNITLSVRKRRQTLHDQNRYSSPSELVDASTETNEDFLSYQVEKDNSKLPDDTQMKELKRLRIMVERLSQQKAALEQRALSLAAPAPLYVATGSAIVQNQQLTDVMKENQKLKKINAKLIHICKKRGKTLSESNRENQDPSTHV